jgi:hypothetical protein
VTLSISFIRCCVRLFMFQPGLSGRTCHGSKSQI